MKVLALLGLLGMAVAIPKFGIENVHLQMEEGELKKVFPRDTSEIPAYEVVSLQWPRLQKRASSSRTKLRLNAFGKNISLWLNPTDGVLAALNTPVYMVSSSSSGIKFNPVTNAMSVVNEMLEDSEKQATVIVKRSEDGRSFISGTVGSEGWVIRPLPARFTHPSRARRSNDLANNATIGEFDEPHWHVVFKTPVVPELMGKPLEGNILRNRQGSRSRRAAVPSTLYPQILVVADYGTYKLHDKNVATLLEYLVPFWNGVDLRYRGLEFPKVRLNIGSFVIAGDENALAYVTKNKVDAENLDIVGTLSSFGQFLPTVQSDLPYSTYDIGVTMGPYSMCAPDDSGTCVPGVLGLAYLTGACDFRHRVPEKTLSVAVIQDKGAFDGMHTAAHELGHLFGAEHDGVDGSLCSAKVGNIMASSPVLTKNSEDWSKCSVNAFDKFFNHDSPTCLFNKPKTSTPLPRTLPGSLMTLDEQCNTLLGTKSCPIDPQANACVRLKCIWPKDNRYCVETGDSAAEGSTCGDKKICVHGQCLAESDIV